MSATTGDDTINGTAGDDFISGLPGNDSIAGGDGNDTLGGGNDLDTLDGGNGDDSLIGGTGGDLLIGGDGADTLWGLGDGPPAADTLDGGVGDDYVFLGNRTGLVIAGGGNDTIDMNGYSESPGAWTQNGTEWTNGVITVETGGSDVLFTGDGATFFSDPNAVCFAAGTRILTVRGEVPVEALRAGDLIATVAGRGPVLAPLLFLGRRRIRLAGNPHAAALAPVRIRAGALGPNMPHRDLLVSPDHCLFLDGALVPARLLVNGRSIRVEKRLAEVTYFHLELPCHEVVLAEGAAAESWLDAGNRAWFENAGTALLRVEETPDAYATEAAEPCAPVIQAGPALAAIRDAIALRALDAEQQGMPACAV